MHTVVCLQVKTAQCWLIIRINSQRRSALLYPLWLLEKFTCSLCCSDAQVRDSSGYTQALAAALRQADDRKYESSDDEVQQRPQQRRQQYGEFTC
jgi:hypothetical protein